MTGINRKMQDRTDTIKKIANFMVKIIISFAIAAVFALWIENRGIKLIPPDKYFSVVQWNYVILYTILLLSFHLFRAYRWYFLVRPLNPEISPFRAIAVAFVGFMAIMLLPLRTGEFARPYFISTTGNISMSSGLGTIAIERIIDGLLLSMLLTICLLLLPEGGNYPLWVGYVGWVTLAIFVIALTIIVLMILYSQGIIKLIEKVFFFLPDKLLSKIVGIFKGFIEGLTTLPDKKAILPFVFFTFIYWGINGVSMWILAKGCGMDIPVIAGYTIMSILAVGILLPTGPGLFGNFQVGIYLGLLLYLPESVVQKNGAVYIFIIYLLQVAVTVILGVGAMFTNHISFKKVIIGKGQEQLSEN